MLNLPTTWVIPLIMMPAVLVMAFIVRTAVGMLRAYYILRIRAGLPVVLWLPKFWSMDGKRQTGSSLSRVLDRMRRLGGPHGMYGTLFGTQAVLHVADPEAAALVLSQHTKSPGYDHFRGFFGRGVFTADGEEWRQKRASVAHAMFRGGRDERGQGGVVGKRGGVDRGGDSAAKATSGGGGSNVSSSLEALANEEAESVLREVEAIMRTQDDNVAEVEIVRLLQRHTLNLIHRFLCGGDHIGSSPYRKRLVTRYLNAVTDMRMVILARSRSVWMFGGEWIYRTFSPLYVRESRNMAPIQEFAELVLDEAGCKARDATITSSGDSSNRQAAAGDTDSHGRAAEGLEEKGWLPRGRGFFGGGGVPWLGKASLVKKPDAVEEAEGREKGDGQGVSKRTALAEIAGRESHRHRGGRHRRASAMIDETITLLFAGQDTTAATLSWTMHLLSLPQNREYLLEVHHEAAAAAAAVCTPRPEDRKRLPMVDACIREAQRLYPVAPFVVRHLRSDLRLKDGTLLPAGAMACVWIYGLHRHPGLWENPDAFLPRRWLDGAKQPAGAFIPYASGPRSCVGRPFASAVLRIILARLCLALDFSPAPGPVTNTAAENAGFPNDMAFPGGLREDDDAGSGAGGTRRTLSRSKSPTTMTRKSPRRSTTRRSSDVSGDPLSSRSSDFSVDSLSSRSSSDISVDPLSSRRSSDVSVDSLSSRSSSDISVDPLSSRRSSDVSVDSLSSRSSSDISGDPLSTRSSDISVDSLSSRSSSGISGDRLPTSSSDISVDSLSSRSSSDISGDLAVQQGYCSPCRGEMKMQAGFTVLPKGGVHLRLAKWPEDDKGFRT